MKFRHPTLQDGTVSFESESYQVAGGIVDCPAPIGEAAGWTRAEPGEVSVSDPSVNAGAPKKADKKKADK